MNKKPLLINLSEAALFVFIGNVNLMQTIVGAAFRRP